MQLSLGCAVKTRHSKHPAISSKTLDLSDNAQNIRQRIFGRSGVNDAETRSSSASSSIRSTSEAARHVTATDTNSQRKLACHSAKTRLNWQRREQAATAASVDNSSSSSSTSKGCWPQQRRRAAAALFDLLSYIVIADGVHAQRQVSTWNKWASNLEFKLVLHVSTWLRWNAGAIFSANKWWCSVNELMTILLVSGRMRFQTETRLLATRTVKFESVDMFPMRNTCPRVTWSFARFISNNWRIYDCALSERKREMLYSSSDFDMCYFGSG